MSSICCLHIYTINKWNSKFDFVQAFFLALYSESMVKNKGISAGNKSSSLFSALQPL